MRITLGKHEEEIAYPVALTGIILCSTQLLGQLHFSDLSFSVIISKHLFIIEDNK